MPAAIAKAVDPPRLVMDAMVKFVQSKSAKVRVDETRLACQLSVEALFPERGGENRRPPRRDGSHGQGEQNSMADGADHQADAEASRPV